MDRKEAGGRGQLLPELRARPEGAGDTRDRAFPGESAEGADADPERDPEDAGRSRDPSEDLYERHVRGFGTGDPTPDGRWGVCMGQPAELGQRETEEQSGPDEIGTGDAFDGDP